MCSGCGNLESQTGQGSPDLYQDARQQADGEENNLSRQTVFHYPVAFEEVQYPVWPEWENVTTVIGGASIEKYIRVVSEP